MEVVMKEYKKNVNVKISIIMPAYNAEDYLIESLQSIQNQTMKEFELIVIDDGSTDRTVAILQDFACKDNRIKILFQEHKGAGPARNLGIKKACGEFIAFMNSDDLYPENTTMEKLYKSAKENNVYISGGSLYQLRDSQLITDPSKFDSGYTFLESKLMSFSEYQFDYGYWRFIFNRSFLINNNLEFPDYLRGQDPPFFVRAMILAGKFYSLKDATYVYRLSHKTIKWTERKLQDAFLSNADILKLSDENHLNTLHINVAKKMANSYLLKECNLSVANIRNAVGKCYNAINQKLLAENNVNVNWHLLYRSLIDLDIKVYVTIILCVYNGEQYLKECLDSITRQSLINIQIICVNDCSTDKSLEILKSYAVSDKRITIINNEKNIGLASSRNKALNIAKGEYIQFVDADDYIDLKTCEIIYNKASSYKLDMISIAGLNFDNDTKNTLPSDYYNFKYLPNNWKKDYFNYKDCKEFICRMAVSSCLTIYNKDFINRINLRFPKGVYFEDNLFFASALFSAERVSIEKTQLYHRRVHSASITKNRDKYYNHSLKIIDLVLTLINSLNITEYPYFENYKKSYISCTIGIFNEFKEDVKNKYYKKLIALCDKYNYSTEAIKYDYINPNGYTKIRNNSYFKLLGIPLYEHKRNPYINYHKISVCGLEVYKKSKYDETAKLSILGIPLFKIQNKSVHKKINILGIQWYKRANPNQNTKRTYILGLPFASKKINGYEIRRRFLCFRTKEYQWERQIVERENQIQSMQTVQHNLMQELISKNSSLEQKVAQLTDSLNNNISSVFDEVENLKTSIVSVKNSVDVNSNRVIGISCENNWADIFNNTIENSSWLDDKSFSPGRWAVGYQFLYVMYRVLNEIKPTNILELGLGQSTKMISQYVAHSEKCKHYVVEHDSNWIDFYSKNYTLPKATTVVQLPWDFVNFKDATDVRCYHNFKETFTDKKFSFILIDAPLGGDMSKYARIDVLSILPYALEKDFVIMIDDSERSGEQRMIDSLKEILTKHRIKFSCGDYVGAKKTTVICSESLSFITSM